jgi:uncharacterized protein (TIGR02145 family)
MKVMKQATLKLIIGILLIGFPTISLFAQRMIIKNADSTVTNAVKIAKKIWMIKNLDVSHFRNGDIIPEVKNDSMWKKAGLEGKPAWCYYGNDSINGKKYGKLYNWYAVTDPRGLAPVGWHIPTNEDWRTIPTTQGGVDVTGGKMKSINGWGIKDLTSNKTGFTALPGGIRSSDGKFSDIKFLAQWWSATPELGKTMKSFSVKVKDDTAEIFWNTLEKGHGFSVRCVKD